MQSHRMTFDCHILLACSTNPSDYTEFLKRNTATRLYLPVWTLKEMDQFCDDFSQYRESYATMGVPVKKEVQASFELLGGVPRYVLRNCKIKEGRQLFQVAIEQLSVYRCSELLLGTFQQGFSDEIIHMCVENVDGVCNYEKYIYTFASSKAQISVWNHLRSNMPQTIVKYISDFWDAPSFGPVVGGMYEAAAHEILRRGGTFKRKRVLEGSPAEALPNLVLGELDSSNFEELEELKNIDHSQYCKPTSRNFESVDAVIVPDLSVGVPRLVQIFKRKGGQNHGYKLQGLKNVDDVLELNKYELLSCVPSVYYDKTGFQTWRDKNGSKCTQLNRDQETLVAKMEQYVVEVDYKALSRLPTSMEVLSSPSVE